MSLYRVVGSGEQFAHKPLAYVTNTDYIGFSRILSAGVSLRIFCVVCLREEKCAHIDIE
ncbi:hypothetical protein [Paenibacillus kribbensis]|uniref:hypothetical protein n=1 Tax=Paenibacillus kribbensis TaxID=172713 RepID=UPI0015B9838C|nr:hypothetical protein [Paenibacillus kribbensis]